MLKKSLVILFIIFSIICISNFCFAENSIGNDIKGTVNSGVNTVVDGASNLAEDVRNGVGDVEDGIEDALTMDNNTKIDTRDTTTTNYNVARTSDVSTSTMGTNTTTMWIWIILAIAAIVIVGLVWYYASQNKVD